MNAWLRSEGTDVVLTLHIQPGAKETGVVGRHGEALKIRLAAPPLDGKANDCLIGFLAKTLGVTKSRIALIGGASSRAKRIRVAGIDAESVRSKLV